MRVGRAGARPNTYSPRLRPPRTTVHFDAPTSVRAMIAEQDLRDLRLRQSNSAANAYRWTALHRDAQGSVRGVSLGQDIVDSSTQQILRAKGERDQRFSYSPYGRQTETQSAISTGKQSKGWIGERYDAEAGLQYLNARYYDPDLLMFLQPDWWEVTEPGVGTNRYAYAGGDPVNGIDPGGHLIIVSPGTNVDPLTDPRYAQGSDLMKSIQNTFGEEPIVTKTQLPNSRAARWARAREIEEIVNTHEFSEGEPLIIVGHSHGNNAVANYTINPTARRIDILISLAMPHRKDTPIDERKIGLHVNVYGRYDEVIPKAGGGDGNVLNPYLWAEAYPTITPPSGESYLDVMISSIHRPGERAYFSGMAGHSNIVSAYVWDRFIAELFGGRR